MIKRVLTFCPYYLPHIGGLENYIDELNKYLSKNDFEVTVFTPCLPKGLNEEELKYKNVKIIRFPAWEIIKNYPLPCVWKKKYWDVKKKLYSVNYSWIISSTRFFITSVMAGIFAKKNKIKWLHIEHGSDFVKLNSKFESFLAKIFDYSFGKWILKKANKVVAVSVAAADFCKKIYPLRNYQVIYRGLDMGKIKDDQKIKNKYKNKVIILFAGRLIDGKGVKDLINAVNKISGNKWILLIVGDGPRKKDLEKQVFDLHLESKVKFLGQFDRLKLLGLLNVSDIIINPSYTEGLPTSVLEAAKCGKAIVATDVGGTREIIENNKTGILITPKNILLLSEKIIMLINDPHLRKELGEAAKKTTKKKFDWENSIKDYVDILK